MRLIPDLTLIRFIWNVCFSRLKICKYEEHSYLGTEIPRDIQQHELNCNNVVVWSAVDAKGVLCPYYSMNGTVIRVEYYSLLHSHVRVQAQQSPENIPTSMEFHLTFHAPSVLFWMKCCQIHGLENMAHE